MSRVQLDRFLTSCPGTEAGPMLADHVSGKVWSGVAATIAGFSFVMPDAQGVVIYMGAVGLGTGIFVASYLSRVTPARAAAKKTLAEAEAKALALLADADIESKRRISEADVAAFRAMEEAQRDSALTKLQEALAEIQELRAMVNQFRADLAAEKEMVVKFAHYVLHASGHTRDSPP